MAKNPIRERIKSHSIIDLIIFTISSIPRSRLVIDHLQLFVGLDHGVRIHREIDGELANRRQLHAEGEISARDPVQDLGDDLAVDGNPGMVVQPDREAAVRIVPLHQVPLPGGACRPSDLLIYMTSTIE